jgi:uncharacterized protein YigE (DUF2233 family)
VYWAFRDSQAPLEVMTSRGWQKVSEVQINEMGEALVQRHVDDGLRWCSLRVKRAASNPLQGLASSVFTSEVHVITLSPERYEFMTSYQAGFRPTTAEERLETDSLDLAILANFREPNDKPMGWVVHEGKKVNPDFPKWTGVFFVKEGRPYFGPKSLVDEVPGEIQEGTQGYPSVMKDHTVFNYVNQAPDRFFDGRKITYRSLAGMRKDGVIVLVLSGDGGVMNVTEVTEIASKLQVQHATLLDGGRALQYSLRLGGGSYHFRAFNTSLDLPYVPRAQRSPVYIGIRRRGAVDSPR